VSMGGDSRWNISSMFSEFGKLCKRNFSSCMNQVPVMWSKRGKSYARKDNTEMLLSGRWCITHAGREDMLG
jgi:hypothetical protein